jgi:hypothetical protein
MIKRNAKPEERMKTVSWNIKMDDVTERFVKPEKEETHDEWCARRCKIMLRDFYLDTQKLNLETYKDLTDFIEKWVKIHFQY